MEENKGVNLSGAKVLSGVNAQASQGRFKSVSEPKQEQEVEEQKIEQQNKQEDAVQQEEQGKESYEQKQNETKEQGQEKVLELSDDDVLKYLKEKKGFNKDSLEFNSSQEKQEMPEQVSKYLEYQKETGRDFKDYLELQKDWKSESEDVVLERFLKEKNPYFDLEDIKDELSEYVYDEDVDDESEIKKKKREKKKLLNEALSYLESQKEKYKAPLEGSSTSAEIPEDLKLAKQKLQEIEKSNKDNQKIVQERTERFLKESENVFTNDFKGFEFDLGDNKVASFKPAEGKDLFNAQSDINNFISKFTNEQGELVDVKGYHKALSAGMNADRLAKHFYEQGKADAISEDAKDSKNINFSGRRVADETKAKKGLKVVEGSKSNRFGFKR